jgi:iron complex transport system substrate-binding protein
MRICSLLPSATEIIADLGLADHLVGVSAECDHPASVKGLPVVTGARIDTSELPSLQIDHAVRDQLRDGTSLYAIDEALIEELAPDVIVTQDLCPVCALSSADVRRVCSVGVEVISLDPRTIAEVAGSARELGRRLGVPGRGDEVADGMLARIDAVRALVGGEPRRRMFLAEWLDPPFAAGHWVPEMVAAAGGVDVLGVAGEPSFVTTWGTVRAGQADLLVLAPCGFDAERAAAEGTTAVPDLGVRTVAVDANAYYSRPAPRIAAGVEQLAHLLHPDAAPDPGLPAIDVVRPGWSGADRHLVAVVVAERPRRVLGEGVAVALAVGGAHEGGDDLEVPLGHVGGLAPEIGEAEIDVELQQVDARRLSHSSRVRPAPDGVGSGECPGLQVKNIGIRDVSAAGHPE